MLRKVFLSLLFLIALLGSTLSVARCGKIGASVAIPADSGGLQTR